MPTLTVEFHGVCTHFTRSKNPFLDLPAAHRVVLPHVPHPITWNGATIPEHAPEVWIKIGDSREKLDIGPATLRLGQITDAPPLFWNAPCPPSLPGTWPGMELLPDVVLNRAYPAGLYFDLYQGELRGVAIGESAAVQVVYDTVDTQVELNIDEWAGTTKTNTLSLPLTLIVSNIGRTGESIEDYDFVLHYAAARDFPPQEQSMVDCLRRAYDDVERCIARDPATIVDLGPGCSNSHFP